MSICKVKKKPAQAKIFSGPRVELGKNIRKRRLSRKLTLVDLALLCATDSSYIGRIERGEINLGFDSLEKIFSALDLDIIDLFK